MDHAELLERNEGRDLFVDGRFTTGHEVAERRARLAAERLIETRNDARQQVLELVTLGSAAFSAATASSGRRMALPSTAPPAGATGESTRSRRWRT